MADARRLVVLIAARLNHSVYAKMEPVEFERGLRNRDYDFPTRGIPAGSCHWKLVSRFLESGRKTACQRSSSPAFHHAQLSPLKPVVAIAESKEALLGALSESVWVHHFVIN
jgi:hypothetical protein